MLCPVVLSHDWNQDSIQLITSAWDARNAMTLTVVIAAALLLWRCLSNRRLSTQRGSVAGATNRCRRSHSGGADVALGGLLLTVPFLPASNLFVTVGFVIAERVLYMPSMGAVLLVAAGLQRMWDVDCNWPRCWRTLLTGATILLTVSDCCRTLQRNRDWQSRESLLRAGLRVLPHNAKMHYNYGNHLRELRQLTQAAAHYREALRLWPQYASVHNNLGSMLRNIDQAEWHFRAAIRYHAEHVNAHYNLGRVHKTKNRTAEAIRMFEHCVQLDPQCVRAYRQLISLRRGPIVGRLHREVLRLEPAEQTHRAHYGMWLLQQSEYFVYIDIDTMIHVDGMLSFENVFQRYRTRFRGNETV